MANAKHIPAGWPALIPRIAVDDPEALVAFIQQVFGAVGRFHPERPSELRIGDSVLMVGSTVARKAMPAFLYVYVEDTDAVFQRALDRGAQSLEEPQDVPYGDRRAMVRDPWDNTWQIATHRRRENEPGYG
jgi:PhnB protein